MAVILSEFPRERSSAGQVTLIGHHGEVAAGPFPAYGRADSSDASAHGNRERDSSQLFGDTPCGDYKVVIAIPTGRATRYDERTYGPVGALILEPSGGDALRAVASGRLGLMIHGGALSDQGALRATNGCIRLSNDDMAALLHFASQLSITGQPLVCKVVEADVSVPMLVEPNSSDRAGDPPPGIQEFIAGQDLSRRSLLKSLIAAGVALSAIAQIPGHEQPPPQPRPGPPPDHDRKPEGHPHNHDRHDEPPHHDRSSHDRDSHDRAHDRTT